MNAIQELLRTFAAILIEEGSYFAAVAISTVVFWKYRYRIWGWLLRNLGRTKGAGTKKSASAKPTTPRQEDMSRVSPPKPRHSDHALQEEAVADEVRLERIMAHLRDQSALAPLIDFDTTRLKREVLIPLHEYLFRLANTDIKPTVVVFNCVCRMRGRTSKGKDWHRWNDKRIFDQVPERMINLKVDYELRLSVSKSREGESHNVEVTGWFVGDDSGSWKIMTGWSHTERQEHEVQMYNWYDLKQRISKLVADLLDNLVDQ